MHPVTVTKLLFFRQGLFHYLVLAVLKLTYVDQISLELTEIHPTLCATTARLVMRLLRKDCEQGDSLVGRAFAT